MRDFRLLFSLPTSLLTLLAGTAVEAQQKTSWPRDARDDLDHQDHLKRDLEIQQRLSWQAPSSVKKMSGDDEGEKFFLHYWDFGEQYTNASLVPAGLNAAIAPHSNHVRQPASLFGRRLFARDFRCPGDTVSCSSVGSDLCCPSGQTCVRVSSGIGCCAEGETCGDEIGTCDADAGYTSCPESDNGGCCVPGATCQGSGCVLYGTETVRVTLPTSTIYDDPPSTTDSDADDQTTAVVPVTTVETSIATSVDTSVATSIATSVATSVQTNEYTTTDTVTVTQSLSGQMTTVTSPTTVVIVRTTATSPTSTDDPSTTTTSSTGTAGAPIRPTSVTSSTTTEDDSANDSAQPTTTSSPTTTALPGCPTGYYMCSAYYLGGCCRVGRDCDTTSCPAGASTDVLTTGPTVVVPATSTATAGVCATGWFGCGSEDGGGCCPSGFACGSASCSATGDGASGATTAKETVASSGGVGSGVGLGRGSMTMWSCAVVLTALWI